MGLSRNKVAVSEGAAGSPPFYGDSEPNLTEIKLRTRSQIRTNQDEMCMRLAELWKVFCCSIIRVQLITQYGGVAQLGEHLPCKQGVMGSNPIISTTD